MNFWTNLKNIKSIAVYLERRTRRQLVGYLYTEEKSKSLIYVFEYDKLYFEHKNSLALGPEFSLLKRRHESRKMFPSLLDRIPSKQNPVYSEYCKRVNIEADEKDPLILLSTLGRKGPSSFVFEPLYTLGFTSEDLHEFRKSLKLSLREFAEVFEFSYAAIARIESKKSSGHDILKRAQLYVLFPQTALFAVKINGHILLDYKKDFVIKVLESKPE